MPVSGRRLRFSGHPTDKALPSSQSHSPPSAEFKSLAAFLRLSTCSASISVLPRAASHLSIMASNSSASSLGKGAAKQVVGEPISDDLDGIPVRVIETGEIRAF